MSPLILMLTAGAGIALLLFLVLKYKFQPFVALMLVSIVVALVAGVKPATWWRPLKAAWARPSAISRSSLPWGR